MFSPTPTGPPAGTLIITDGIIRSTTTPQQATTTFAFFDNTGGFLRINGLTITNTNPNTPIFNSRVDSKSPTNYKLSWITESYAMIQEYRLLYRKLPVSEFRIPNL